MELTKNILEFFFFLSKALGLRSNIYTLLYRIDNQDFPGSLIKLSSMLHCWDTDLILI